MVAGISRTNTFLGERYRRLARRQGNKRAIVALGNSALTIVWHLLSNPNTHYHDLGPNYHQSKTNQQRRQRDLIRQLEHSPARKPPSNHHRTTRRGLTTPSINPAPQPGAGHYRMPTHSPNFESAIPRGQRRRFSAG